MICFQKIYGLHGLDLVEQVTLSRSSEKKVGGKSASLWSNGGLIRPKKYWVYRDNVWIYVLYLCFVLDIWHKWHCMYSEREFCICDKSHPEMKKSFSATSALGSDTGGEILDIYI